MPSTEMKDSKSNGYLEYKKTQFNNKKEEKQKEKELAKSRKEKIKLEQELQNIRDESLKAEIKKKIEAQTNLINEYEKQKEDAELRIADTLAKRKEEVSKKVRENNEKAADKLGENIKAAVGELKSSLDSTMENFIEKQESMAYGLTGTSKSFEDVTTTFTKALGSTGVVKQQEVYENLSNLIQSGIVFNAEQRAYLGTIAEDLGMVFDPAEGSLTRLINLQRKDLSDERMAIEYSLKQFLNQNYQTSQYIKEGFENVSSSLIEAQSLMSSVNAMQFEASVQQWLGSMSSVGASTDAINKLAEAIGELGSGNLDVLSSDIFPLLAMAASNVGLSIGDVLNNGLNSSSADALLRGVAQYAGSIYSGSSSNIVLSELGKAFGISNVSDLVALSQVGITNGTEIGTNINNLLSDMDNYLYTTNKINNTLANFMYSWAVGVAGNETQYTIYKVTDIITSALDSIVGGFDIDLGVIDLNVGSMLETISLLPLLGGLWNSVGGLASEIKNGSSAQSIYKALGGGQLAGSNQKIGIAGLFSGLSKKSGLNTSGSMVYFNTDTNDLGSTVKTSALENSSSLMQGEEESKTLNDVYALLEEFKTTSFGTYTKIVESDNTVTIGNDLSFVQDMITFSAFNIQNIYALLVEYLKPENVESQRVYDLDNVQWSSPFDWYSSAGSNLRL